MKLLRKITGITLTITILLSMVITGSVTASALNNSDDYRTWSHHDSRWSSRAMGTGTLGNGGAPTTAVTKLAIQAGLRDAYDFDIGSMAALLTNNSGYSGSAIVWSALTKNSLKLFSSYSVLHQAASGSSFTSSSYNTTLINEIKGGYHLVIQVTNSSGTTNYVAVDEQKTLASNTVYIMDCLTNASNNINIALSKRYSTFTRVIGYKGEASSNSTPDSDYRKWEKNNSTWSNLTLSGTTRKFNTSLVGGGDLVLAATKLAIQAGTVDKENAVSNAVASMNSSGGFDANGVISSWDDLKNALNFQTYNNTLMGSGSDTAIMTSSLYTSEIINKLNEGYHLAIRINNSVGWIAVDTDKTLAENEVYLMRSTPDSTKNADIKLTDYYSSINRVAGFKADGVQVNLEGNAEFTAEYTKSGVSSPVSFKSGAFVPDGASVSVTASPKKGYEAGSSGNYWTNSNFSGSESGNHLTYTFTADKSTATSTTLAFLTSKKSYGINYVYGEKSSGFNYTSLPSSAQTGDTITMTISAKSDATYVYELQISVKDDENNDIAVTHNGNNYTFTMPSSEVTVTFTGRNVDDWRRWARDDERWRDYVITVKPSNGNENTVFSDGAVVLSLAKMVIQAGIADPTTLAEEHWDVRDTVDALNASVLFDPESAQLFFTSANRGGENKTSSRALGFDSVTGFLSVSTVNSNGDGKPDTQATSSNRGDILGSYSGTLVTNLKNGYHQILRICSNSSSLVNADSEWVVIDEEKTLQACGNKTSGITASDIYVFRATADTTKNAYHTLQEFYDETGYRYVWRNYAYLGGTTPARQVNYTIYKNGTDTTVTDAHKGSVNSTYTIPGEEGSTAFSSGDFVPSRANINFKYEADYGYYAFDNWTETTSVTSTALTSPESDNPAAFNINPSEFRASSGSIVNSTTANIRCNINPEEYNLYYEGDSHISFSGTSSTANYKDNASFTIVPESGYSLDTLTYKDKDDNTITITPTVSGKTYTFTMPAQDVYINATSTEQTYDDFRAWGVNDDRWKTTNIRPDGNVPINTNTSNGGDAIMAFAKLLIQSGYPTNLKNSLSKLYSAMEYTDNGTFMTEFIGKASSKFAYIYDSSNHSTNYNLISSSGKLNDSSSGSLTALGQWGMGFMAANLSITDAPKYNNYSTYFSDGATAGGTRDQAFVYTQLLHSSDSGNTTYSGTVNGNTRYFKGGPYNTNDFTNLIKDYLAGTNNTTISNVNASGATTRAAATNYDNINNTHNYKFHIMIYVNDTYGWVAVDEPQTLNTGEIWVWASHGVVSGNGTSENNIVKLSTLSSTFERAAGFKFSSTYNLYGSDKVEFTPYELPYVEGTSTASTNATLKATYTYLGKTYPASGNYNSGLYVPHEASVTISQTSINSGFKPAESTDDLYKPWNSLITPSSSSDTKFIFDTDYQGAKSTRTSYTAKYFIEALPKAHLKFRALANGELRGQRDGVLSENEEYVYLGDSTSITPVPDSGYEEDELRFIKVRSWSDMTVISTELVDPLEFTYTFDAERTGGEECYYIIEATFKRSGNPLEITYHYNEYNPTAAGSYEYIENDPPYVTEKTYTVDLDYYDTEQSAQALANVNLPVITNNYFDYTIDSVGTIDTTSDTHTLSVNLREIPREYSVTVNNTLVGDNFHFQEEIALEYSSFGIGTDNVVWSRTTTESGKTGLAIVSYKDVYKTRVTSDLVINVSENYSDKTSADGTSAVTPAYTEVFPDSNGVEKCRQNFYVQDFFDTEDPRAYDSDGEVIDNAENVTFLGAGALFYLNDSSTGAPAKSALAGKVSRSDIYDVLESNKNRFLSQDSVQTTNFYSSNLSCSYINFNSDKGSILRYAGAANAYNYFFQNTITNNRSDDMQKYSYRVYSFYVVSYQLNGNTYVAPVMSDNFAEAKVYSQKTS